jgi:hypothetical protein
MTGFSRVKLVMILGGGIVIGLVLWAFYLGYWYGGGGTRVVSVPVAPVAVIATPANMPAVAEMERLAADFDKRHPPLAIPAVFPQAVSFGLGKTYFPGVDSFTITEIQGTSDVFTLGGVYEIKGTYNLSTRDQGSISASITAKNHEDGVSNPQSCQGAIVTRGQGQFTLILPMRCEGWPHVTLHSDGGASLADVYFGTGDWIWKK